MCFNLLCLHVIFIKQLCQGTMPEAIQTPLFHNSLILKLATSSPGPLVMY
jgi:hypothetical protein